MKKYYKKVSCYTNIIIKYIVEYKIVNILFLFVIFKINYNIYIYIYIFIFIKIKIYL